MKKLSFLLLLASFAGSAAYADSIHKIQSSVQLTVNSAATQATRIGNNYSVTGSNVTTSDGPHRNALTTGAITVVSILQVLSLPTQATAGEAFSYSVSYTEMML